MPENILIYNKIDKVPLKNNGQGNNLEVKDTAILSLEEILKNPKKLWGQFILHLRNNNLMTLHTACGEIREFSFNNFTLKAVVYEKYLYDILTKEENFSKIALELKRINDKINIEFVLKEKGNDKVSNNIKILKDLFGDEICFI